MDKKKGKRLLYEMSTAEERKELSALEFADLNDQVEALQEAFAGAAKASDITALIKQVTDGINKMSARHISVSRETAEAFKEMQEGSLKAVKAMHESLVKHSEGQAFNKNAGPVYKTMINHLAGMETAFKGWKYPQYAAVSVRNKNFANINPAISSFGIEDYDDVVLAYTGSNLTTVTYKLNGNTTAVLTLSYDGSNNLTEAKRTT